MIIPLIAGFFIGENTKSKSKGLSGSWHAKDSKYRFSTGEKQKLKKGYKFDKNGNVINVKTGKVFKDNDKVTTNKNPKRISKKKTKPKVKESGIKILKTSPKGAMLITDGTKIAWIMPRQKRKDGTFTSGAEKALKKSTNKLEDFNKTGKTSNKKLAYMVKYEIIARETDKALLVVSFNGSEDWIPKMAVHNSPSNSTKSDSILVEAWALKNKDIQYSMKKKYYV